MPANPEQFAYNIVNGVATATFPGNVTILGSLLATPNASYSIVELEAMQLAQMSAVKQVDCYSYYAGGNNGGGKFQFITTATTPINGFYIPPTDYPDGSHGVFARIVSEAGISPEMAGAKCDGVSDDLAAFQACVAYLNAGSPYRKINLRVGTYYLSAGLKIVPWIDLNGVGSGNLNPANCTHILCADNVNPAFYLNLMDYVGPFELEGFIKIHDMWIDSFKPVRIGNRSDGTGSGTDPFQVQPLLMNVEIYNLRISPNGSHHLYGVDIVDPQANTATVIADYNAFIDTYGGMEFNKCYRALIHNLHITGVGIGGILNGCDCTVVYDSFVGNSGNAFASFQRYGATGDWGARVRILRVQSTGNARVRHINASSNELNIDKCYLEGSDGLGGTTVLYVSAHDITVSETSFDGNGNATNPPPLVHISTGYGCKFIGCTIQLGQHQTEHFQYDVGCDVQMLGCSNYFVQAATADAYTPHGGIPGLVVGEVNPRIFSPQNPKVVGGTGSTNLWMLNSTNNCYVFPNTSGSTIINFDTNASDDSIKIGLAGVFHGANTAYVKVTWGGTQIYGGNAAPSTSATTIQTVVIGPFTKPAGVGFGREQIVIEAVADGTVYNSIEVYPV